jgi:hypothetical protein
MFSIKKNEVLFYLLQLKKYYSIRFIEETTKEIIKIERSMFKENGTSLY